MILVPGTVQQSLQADASSAVTMDDPWTILVPGTAQQSLQADASSAVTMHG